MVRTITCDCKDRNGIRIDSYKLFRELDEFFRAQVSKGIFDDISDYSRIWYEHGGSEKNIYRETKKCFVCKACGCLWEFIYPEFPAAGQILKHPTGVSTKKEAQTHGYK